jgi:uncharacterized protein with PIN domain
MRFLCDEMLKRLGQWLRAAGYDVVILPDGSADAELIDRASLEGRILLTRDRHLHANNTSITSIVLLECNGLEDCVDALGRQLPIDWQRAPFTRCMVCNTPLVPADDVTRREVPARVRETAPTTLYCPRCEKVYWAGSHVARMQERLASWSHRD